MSIYNDQMIIVNIVLNFPIFAMKIPTMRPVVELVTCSWSRGLRPKKLYASVVCYQLLFDFLANNNLPECHVSYVCRLMV